MKKLARNSQLGARTETEKAGFLANKKVQAVAGTTDKLFCEDKRPGFSVGSRDPTGNFGLGRKRRFGRWGGLPVLAAALLPVFARGFDQSNFSYFLRDEVNEGGTRQSNASYILNGSVGAMSKENLSNGNYQIAMGLQSTQFFPTTITDLTLLVVSNDTISMSWMAPATGVSNNERVSKYEIRYSPEPITDSNFNAAVLRVGDSVTPSDPGQIESSVPLSGLTYDTPYYVGIVSFDDNIPSNASFVGTAGPLTTLANSPDFIKLETDTDARSVTLTFKPNNNDGHSIKFEGIISLSSDDPVPDTPGTGTLTLTTSSNEDQTMTFSHILYVSHEAKRLKRSTGYYVHMRAYNSNDVPTAWVPCGSAIIDGKLPTDLTANSLTASSFDVQWKTEFKNGDYQAIVADNSEFTGPNVYYGDKIFIPNKVSIGSQPFSILKGNTQYFYKVRAWDQDETDPIGDAGPSSVFTHVLKPTDGSVTADSLSKSGATIRWEENVNNSSEAHSYHVELATRPFTSSPEISAERRVPFTGGSNMEAAFDSLKPNTPYYVRITGKNSVGVDSAGTDVYTSASPLFYTHPSQPLVTIAPAVDPVSQVAFKVDPQYNDSLSTEYLANLYPSLDCSMSSVQSLVIDRGRSLADAFNFSSMEGSLIYANKQYSVCVEAKWAGSADDRTYDTYSVAKSTLTKPLAPQGLSPVAEGTDQMRVSWSDRLGTTMNAVGTKYQLEWREEGSPSPIDAIDVPDISKVVNGLTPNTTYQFTLVTLPVTGSSWGPSSSQVKSAVTWAKAPVVTSYLLDSHSAMVAWTENGNPVGKTLYRIEASASESFDPVSSFVETRISPAPVLGLIPNTTYYARMKAINHSGVPTDWVNVWTASATLPVAPLITDYTLYTDSGTVTWNPNGNHFGTRYAVWVSLDDKFSLSPVKYEVTQTTDGDTPITMKLPDLTSNQRYYVRVDVLGHNGKTLSSDILNKMTSPSPLAGLTFEPTGGKTRELTLSWDNTKNSPETSYVAEISTDSGFNISTKVITAPNARANVFSRLISNKLYYGRVRPNVDGASFSEIKMTYTFPESPLDVRPLTSVSAPTHQVSLQWSHGNNAPETVYVVSLKLGETILVSPRETNPGDTSWEFNEIDGVVTANQEYTASVRAKSAGPGENSEEVSTRLFTAPLAPLNAVVSDVSTGFFKLSWDSPVKSVGEKLIQNSASTEYQLEWSWFEDSRRRTGLAGVGSGGSFYYNFGEGSPLIPNTTYFINIKALRGPDIPWDSPLYSLEAITNPKSPTLISGNIKVHQTSMTVVWGSNGNPDGTVYELAVGENYSRTEVTSLTTPAVLIPSSDYNVRVRSLGRNGSIGISGSFTRTTLPSAPVITNIEKPDPDADGQKLRVHWDNGDNGSKVHYKVSVDGVRWLDDPSGNVALFDSLSPNQEMLVRVRANNGFDASYVEVVSRVWTRAEIPSAPTIQVPLFERTMGIGFPASRNPAETRYSIQIMKGEDKGKFASEVSPGVVEFTSLGPVWLTRAQWAPSGRVMLINLPDETGYKVVLYTINQPMENTEGPGPGLNIEQSAGEPFVELDTIWGRETQVSSWDKKVYTHASLVRFFAKGSSHYNVLWRNEEIPVNASNLTDSYGWNGTLADPGSVPCISTSDSYAVNDTAVSGFCSGNEGVYFLNVAGTAIIGETLDSDHILPTLPFRVFIDTTPPVTGKPGGYFSSARAPMEIINEGEVYGDPDPYLTWNGLDEVGRAESRSPVIGWAISFSPDPSEMPELSTSSARFIPFSEGPGKTFDDPAGFLEPTTFYFKVRGFDQAGNWTPESEMGQFEYRYNPDQVSPRWNRSGVSMKGVRFPTTDEKIRFAAVDVDPSFVNLEFSEAMILRPNDSVKLQLLRGTDGKTVIPKIEDLKTDVAVVEKTVEGSTVTVHSMTLAAQAPLQPGCLYRFYSSTRPAPVDRANNPITTPIDVLFYTAMDPAKGAVFVSEDGQAEVRVGPGALGPEAAGVAINDRPDVASLLGSSALPRLLDGANDALGRQRGGAFRQMLSIKELSVFNSLGARAAESFSGDVRLVFEAPAEAVAAGRSVRLTDLAVYELDQKTGVWNKMPDSQVDESARTVSVALNHDGTFGLGSGPNFDLSNAHPYPVPFRAARGSAITFTGLSSYGTIKIFTLDGQRVKTIPFNGVSFVRWDPVANDSGDLLGSDVYLYVIENDQQRVVGKLMVIR